MWLRRLSSPAIILFFLAGMISELLSGSTGPIGYFNPLGLVIFSFFYGGGALIARELTYRWHKGWPTVLTLGAAYGIVEEGLSTKTFFDPNRTDLSPLVNYGSSFGVHWPFIEFLTIFHAVFSISIPILLVSLIFPDQVEKSWVSKKKLYILGILFVLETIWISLTLFPYHPSEVHYLITILVVGFLIVLSKRLPNNLAVAKPFSKPTSKLKLFILGFLATLGLFLSWAMPEWKVPPLIAFFYLLILPFVVGRRVLQMTDNTQALTSISLLTLAAGAQGFFIVFAFIQEFSGNRGMSLVGLGVAILLFWIYRRIKNVSTINV